MGDQSLTRRSQSYHEGHGQAYEKYGVDPAVGAAVILRPDQYVSWVGEFDDYEAMDGFFSGFMLEQKPSLGEVVSDAKSVRLDYGGSAARGFVAGDGAASGLAAL